MDFQDLGLYSLPQLCLREWWNQDTSLCVLESHLIIAKVKPVGIEQEVMYPQGLKVKSIRESCKQKA